MSNDFLIDVELWMIILLWSCVIFEIFCEILVRLLLIILVWLWYIWIFFFSNFILLFKCFWWMLSSLICRVNEFDWLFFSLWFFLGFVDFCNFFIFFFNLWVFCFLIFRLYFVIVRLLDLVVSFLVSCVIFVW